MIKVLFISQWYPHRYDKMAGLFVQKHAEAVSLFCDVQVLYVHPDPSLNHFEVVETEHGRLKEMTVYYPGKNKNTFQRIIKTLNYIKAYWVGYKLLSKRDYKPDIVHVNILTRTAVFAYLLKLWKGIPYVVTEHWSRYLAIRGSFNGTLRKLVTKLVVRNAEAILPVSESLKKAMLAHNLKNDNYTIVSNVVDDFFFEETVPVHRPKKRMIHVSCFDERAKNVKGILRATYELSKKRDDFELIIIGTGVDFEEVNNFARELDFPKGIVHFLGEKTPQEVANWMKNSDFFVMFSNFENAPVVISESLACGKPILSSNVGGISELVNDDNGILVIAGNEKLLEMKMDLLLDSFASYQSDAIIQQAKEKFSYQSVGLILSNVYKQILKCNNHEI